MATLLKDPLQTDLFPHDLLGVAADCSDERAIDGAYALALRSSEFSSVDVTQAHRDLRDPLRRAEHSLLLYHRRSFSAAIPSPFEDASVLNHENRALTAIAWEAEFRRRPSETWLAHALAVLWYSWARCRTLRVVADLRPRAGVRRKQATEPLGHDARSGELHACWLKAIGYWGHVASTGAFWEAQRSEGVDPSALRRLLLDRLRNALREAERADTAAAHLQPLAHVFDTELETAAAIGALGLVRLGATGPVLLQQMGMLDPTRRQVDRLLKDRPRSRSLHRLRKLLSPYRWLETLADQDHQRALEVIHTLPAEQQSIGELVAVTAQARHAQARACADRGDYDSALRIWRGVRRQQRTRATDRQIVGDVVSVCLRAAAEADQEPDRAIELLEAGLTIVASDRRLEVCLAEHLARRGTAIINRAIREAEGAPGEPERLLEGIRGGMDVIDRAIELDHDTAEAAAVQARDLMARVERQFPAWARAAREAREAARADDWASAIELLRKALRDCPRRERSGLRKSLAVCLVNRATEQANAAITAMSSAPNKSHEALWTHLEKNRAADRCSLCGKSRYSADGEAWCEVRNQDGGTAEVCAQCATLIGSVRAAAGRPGVDDVAQLLGARNQLIEAIRLDPENEDVRSRLSDLRGVVARIPAEVLWRAQSGPLARAVRILRGTLEVGGAVLWGLALLVGLPAAVGGLCALGSLLVGAGSPSESFATGFQVAFVVALILVNLMPGAGRTKR